MEDEITAGVFIPSNLDKANAKIMCLRIIDLIEDEAEDDLFKAYVLQMLIESFEMSTGIDIKKSFSFQGETTK